MVTIPRTSFHSGENFHFDSNNNENLTVLSEEKLFNIIKYAMLWADTDKYTKKKRIANDLQS